MDAGDNPWAIEVLGYLVPHDPSNGRARQLAGNLAGGLFDWMAWIGIAAGAYLLVYRIADIPDVGRTVAIWRDACRAGGWWTSDSRPTSCGR